MMEESQKGVSLVIVFLIMTVMLAVVLGFSNILFNKIKMLGNIGDSVSSFYAAESGIEKTLYFDRKEIPRRGNRGLCDICETCSDCTGCTLNPLSSNGCSQLACTNCEVRYTTMINNKSYQVSAKATPELFFSCESTGTYKDTVRNLEVRSASISAPPY